MGIHSVDFVLQISSYTKVVLAINHGLLSCHQTPFPELQENRVWCGQLLNPAETTCTINPLV
jgi:hypothetical protein